MRDSAIGILFKGEQKRELLLVQRADVPVWVLPGGGIEQGETPEEACKREVFEETGLQVRIVKKVGHFLSINRFTSAAHVFVCVHFEGTLCPGEEERCAEFFSLDHLPCPLFPFHRDWLAEALKEHAQPICAPMSRKTFWQMVAYFIFHPIWSLRYLLTRYRARSKQIEQSRV